MSSQTYTFTAGSSFDDSSNFESDLRTILDGAGIEEIVGIGTTSHWNGHSSGANDYDIEDLDPFFNNDSAEWELYPELPNGIIGTVNASDHDGSTFVTFVAAPPRRAFSGDYSFKGMDVAIDRDSYDSTSGDYTVLFDGEEIPSRAWVVRDAIADTLIEAVEDGLDESDYEAEFEVYTDDYGKVTPASRLFLVANLYSWNKVGKGVDSFSAVLDLLKD